MATYRLTTTYLDSRGGQTLKQFDGTFDTFDLARADAVLFVGAQQAVSTAAITEWSLAEIVTTAEAPDAGSRVTERISATVELGPNKRANLQFPAPDAPILSGNNLDIESAEWVAVTSYITAPKTWTISDDEQMTGTVRGKIITVRSGPRTLPT